jgi:hypothetical protein
MRNYEQRRVTILESILCCLVERERAAAMVGDLLETHADGLRVWFYLASLRLIVSLALRSLAWWVGSVIAGFAAFLVLVRIPGLWHASYVRALQNPYNRWFWHFVHYHHRTFEFFELSHGFVSVPFLCAGAVLFWRYGYRSRMTQLAAILFLSGMPWTYYPNGLLWIAGTVVMVVVILGPIFAPQWRKPLFILMASTLPACFLLKAGFFMAFTVFGHVSYLRIALGCSLMICGTAVFCLVCFWLQNRFLPEDKARRELA